MYFIFKNSSTIKTVFFYSANKYTVYITHSKDCRFTIFKLSTVTIQHQNQILRQQFLFTALNLFVYKRINKWSVIKVLEQKKRR